MSSGSGIKEIAYDIRMPNGKLPNGSKSYSSNFPTKVMLNDVNGKDLNYACFTMMGKKNYGKYAPIITVTDRTGKKVRKALNVTYF